jgi:hypothetical protein
MTDDINATEQNPFTKHASLESHQSNVAINSRAKESKHAQKNTQFFFKCQSTNTDRTPPNIITHTQTLTSPQM